MRTQSTTTATLFSTLSNAELKTLTTTVDETLAFKTSTPKTFTAADLWNIQKQRRIFSVRRF